MITKSDVKGYLQEILRIEKKMEKGYRYLASHIAAKKYQEILKILTDKTVEEILD